MKNSFLTIFTIIVLLSSGMVFPIQSVYAETPNAPTNLNDNATPPTTTTISLQWTAPASGATPNGYKITKASETSFGVFGSETTVIANTGTTDTSFTVTGLSEGDFFRFKVYSINSGDRYYAW